ncbi:retrovirus-related Pol polyprotein from transposon 412 [Trichonephila clavipes]|nr:retrovirus-related Pol polyprotein from transposon 412 [Trichonephila clavipes]
MCGVTRKKCCRKCDPCAVRKSPKKCTRGRLQLYNVGAASQRIAFDFIGPLPRSSDGNNIILVFNTGSHDSGFLYNCFPFKGEASILYFARYCVKYLPSTKPGQRLLHLQSDGMVERFNQNSLSLLLSSNQQDWIKKLPFFLRGVIYETTGYSPSQRLFGSDLHLSADLLFSRPPDEPLMSEEYIEKLQARMEEMHHLARERISMASEKMKTRYVAKATGHDFREGDKVWLWNPKRRKGLSPKLQINWEVPYTVLKRLNDVVVWIQKSPHSKKP